MGRALNTVDTDAPDEYVERLLQAQLVNFWRSFPPRRSAHYEAMVAEERYEIFCKEFLTELPPIFALQPSQEWNERLKKLPLQRQVLHVAIFDAVCHNFRPVLLLEPTNVQSLPAYEQMLVASHKRRLAVAALKVLKCASSLHALLGNSFTRFSTIILPTFEAAVILISAIADGQSSGTNSGNDELLRRLDIDPLRHEMAHFMLARCCQAVQEALARLQMLAQVSEIAKTGARTLARLMAKIPSGLLEACDSNSSSHPYSAG